MRWQQMPRFLPKWHLGQKTRSQLCVEVTGVPPAGSEEISARAAAVETNNMSSPPNLCGQSGHWVDKVSSFRFSLRVAGVG